MLIYSRRFEDLHWYNQKTTEILIDDPALKPILFCLNNGDRDLANSLPSILKNISDVQVSRGFFDQAIDVAKEIHDENMKSRSLSYISENLADNELFDQAIDVAKEIHDENMKSRSLSHISENLADNELFDQAIEVAREIHDENMKSRSLSHISENLADNELFDQAIEVAREIHDENLLVNTMLHISDKLLAEGKYDIAFETAKSAVFGFYFSRGFDHITDKLLRDNSLDFDKALEKEKEVAFQDIWLNWLEGVVQRYKDICFSKNYNDSCRYSLGCAYPDAYNYDFNANYDDMSCKYCTDFDENVYKTVQIGDQLWMAENLKTSQYNNGDEILYGDPTNPWALHTAAYSYYNNKISNFFIYGNLYNWYAVDDDRGVCPEGFHIPSDDEWMELVNNPAFRSSGFLPLPGGCRDAGSRFFENIGKFGYFWSSSNGNSGSAWSWILNSSNSEDLNQYHKLSRFSVRCLAD